MPLIEDIGNWIQGAAATCLDFLGKIPRAVFGDAVDSEYGRWAATLVFIAIVSYAITGIRSVSTLFVAKFDLGFSQAKIDDYNDKRGENDEKYVFDWGKARRQQSRSLSFLWPVGLIALGSMYYWVRYDLTSKGYFLLAMAWFAFYLLVIKPWWINTKLRSDRNLVDSGVITRDKAPYYHFSTRQGIQHYMGWGLYGRKKQRSPIFIGGLRYVRWILAPFAWVRKRMITPFLWICVLAAAWMITAPLIVFWLGTRFDRRRYWLRPPWAPDYAIEPTIHEFVATSDSSSS
ncbi:MAG TPA: hypothetical protein VLA77_03880 [Candidatus Saccharimonadales bacterium]|nr:hypothetical protein [Candidatus Saccharimonadales bacterium]